MDRSFRHDGFAWLRAPRPRHVEVPKVNEIETTHGVAGVYTEPDAVSPYCAVPVDGGPQTVAEAGRGLPAEFASSARDASSFSARLAVGLGGIEADLALEIRSPAAISRARSPMRISSPLPRLTGSPPS